MVHKSLYSNNIQGDRMATRDRPRDTFLHCACHVRCAAEWLTNLLASFLTKEHSLNFPRMASQKTKKRAEMSYALRLYGGLASKPFNPRR